jgi:hypothetical protein
MERNAEAEKTDLITKLPTQKTNHQLFERSEQAQLERSEPESFRGHGWTWLTCAGWLRHVQAAGLA